MLMNHTNNKYLHVCPELKILGTGSNFISFTVNTTGL